MKEFAVEVESATGHVELTRRRFTDADAAAEWAARLGKVWKRASVVPVPSRSGVSKEAAIPKGEALARCFAAIERAAEAGNRCPMNGTHGVTSTLVCSLARSGKIRVSVYALNYRTVDVLTGPQAGKSTALPPAGYGPPYRVIGAARRAA